MKGVASNLQVTITKGIEQMAKLTGQKGVQKLYVWMGSDLLNKSELWGVKLLSNAICDIQLRAVHVYAALETIARNKGYHVC